MPLAKALSADKLAQNSIIAQHTRLAPSLVARLTYKYSNDLTLSYAHMA